MAKQPFCLSSHTSACTLEAAMIASQRGHDVTLMEQEDALGGHVNLVARLPGLGDPSVVTGNIFTELIAKKSADANVFDASTPSVCCLESLFTNKVLMSRH